MSVNLLLQNWMSAVINILAAFIVVLLPNTSGVNIPQPNHLLNPQEPTETESLLPRSTEVLNSAGPVERDLHSLHTDEQEDGVHVSKEGSSFTDVLRTAKKKLSIDELEALRSFSLANKNVRLCLLGLLVTRLGSSSMEI